MWTSTIQGPLQGGIYEMHIIDNHYGLTMISLISGLRQTFHRTLGRYYVTVMQLSCDCHVSLSDSTSHCHISLLSSMLLSLLPDAPLGCVSSVILSLYCATSVLNTAVSLLLLALYPLLCGPFCPARQRPLHTFPASLFCPAYLFTPTSFFICSSASFLSS